MQPEMQEQVVQPEELPTQGKTTGGLMTEIQCNLAFAKLHIDLDSLKQHKQL